MAARWSIFISVLLVVAGIIVGTLLPAPKPIPFLQTSSSFKWTAAQVHRTILSSANNQTATHIEVLDVMHQTNRTVVFAVFDKAGQTNYATLFVDSHGYNMSTFVPKQIASQPVVWSTQIAERELAVLGVIYGHPDVKTAVLAFSNGSVATVPVSHGRFWYVGSTSNTPPRNVFGITSSGKVVQDQKSGLAAAIR